jgi:glutamate/tyrosine decarboxylase-like PLP-dependent enzyme
LWLPLLVHGLAPFRASLEEKLLLAEWLHAELVRRGWEVGPEPDLSVIIYRRVPAGWDLERVNRLNQRIVDLVKQDGRVYVSSTMIDSRYRIRYAGVTHRTHLSTVRLLLDQLEQTALAAERELVAGVGEPEVRSTV